MVDKKATAAGTSPPNPGGAKGPSLLEAPFIDPTIFSRSMADIAERSQRIVKEWLQRQAEDGPQAPDSMHIGSAFLEMTTRLIASPQHFMQAQIGFWNDYLLLWQNTAKRMLGEPVDEVIEPDPKDKRFKDNAWKENEVFDFIKQSYLLSARFVQDVVSHVDDLDEHTARKVDFYTRQFVDAMSPSNFVLTNPEVLRKTAETGGENLVRGLNNMLADLERGKGSLRISMTDAQKFKLGNNIAISPGRVVFENDLMQLIQYAPSTEQVLKRPLLIIPPWINKFYILDLRAKNSFVRWAVAQGHTVFMISWVNPSGDLHDKNFEDYMQEGPLAALDAITKATGENAFNVIGYCLGGTLLSATLAYMAAHKDNRVKSATFFVSMLDFSEAGEIEVFIDEEQISALEEKMNKRGYLDGGDMSNAFNMLRANDLIWSFVVNNYMLGNDPFPFDLLYWNSDSTRMPAAMHSFYLRNMYQQNKLREPGGITLSGTKIDLRKIKTPAYFLSTREDHIAPWKTTYLGTGLLKGPIRFVLAASGHIAGVVNPPEAGKYSHWINPDLAKTSEEWFEGATEIAGSWWPDWQRWVTAQGGASGKAMVPARVPAEGIEAAPGRYVAVKDEG